jgi:putative membrane protein
MTDARVESRSVGVDSRQRRHSMSVSTDLPDATRLALDRTRLAYERTLMAWTRTATSLISFGFTIYKFFQYLREGSPSADTGLLGPRGFALVMIAIGLTALLLATLQHRQSMTALRDEYGSVPYSLAAVVAALIALLGVLGLVLVLLRL